MQHYPHAYGVVGAGGPYSNNNYPVGAAMTLIVAFIIHRQCTRNQLASLARTTRGDRFHKIPGASRPGEFHRTAHTRHSESG